MLAKKNRSAVLLLKENTMPGNRTHHFQELTIPEQQALIARFHGRKDVRDANRKLAKLVLSWIVDHPISNQEFMELFEVAGHKSEYHENPTDTTSRKVMPQATELPNILKRLEDTPLDYMGVIELNFVYERIQKIIATLTEAPRGTMQQAIDLYEFAGEAIRQKVYIETGHYPEEFPTPRGRITGSEKPSQFKLTDHQPPLF
jgi:hypothetical protein